MKNLCSIIIVIITVKNVKVSMSTSWRHTGTVEVQFHAFWTLALEGDQWSTSRSYNFIPKEMVPVNSI